MTNNHSANCSPTSMPAECHAAAEPRAGHAEHVAQYPQERSVTVDIDLPIDAVDLDRGTIAISRLFSAGALRALVHVPCACGLAACAEMKPIGPHRREPGRKE